MQTAKCLECLLYLLPHFLAKTIFPEGMGDVHNTSGNYGGGRLFLWSKPGHSREEGGGGGLK